MREESADVRDAQFIHQQFRKFKNTRQQFFTLRANSPSPRSAAIFGNVPASSQRKTKKEHRSPRHHRNTFKN